MTRRRHWLIASESSIRSSHSFGRVPCAQKGGVSGRSPTRSGAWRELQPSRSCRCRGAACLPFASASTPRSPSRTRGPSYGPRRRAHRLARTTTTASHRHRRCHMARSARSPGGAGTREQAASATPRELRERPLTFEVRGAGELVADQVELQAGGPVLVIQRGDEVQVRGPGPVVRRLLGVTDTARSGGVRSVGKGIKALLYLPDGRHYATSRYSPNDHTCGPS